MEIVTARLILRDFVAEDLPAIVAYQANPLYQRYYDTPVDAQAWAQKLLGWFLAQQQDRPRFKFQMAVVLKSSGQLIGSAGIRKDAVESHEASIGYELDPDHWGQGYATEAASAMVEFGLGSLRPHRIWANCVAENTASAHVLEKLGMRLEGRLRHKEYFKGRWWDMLLYGMLEDELKPYRPQSAG